MKKEIPLNRYVFINIFIIIIIIKLILFIIIGIDFNNLSSSITISILNWFIYIVILSIIAILLTKSGYFNNLISKYKSKMIIEDSLISLDIKDKYKDNIVLIPKINIDINNKNISIDIRNPKWRIKIENNIDILSSGLPDNWVINKTYITENETTLVIEYIDIGKDTRTIINSYKEFKEISNRLKYNQIILDDNNIIDLSKTPHLLITGSTGSGKSYFTIFNIICYGLIKSWNISILDFKHQYHIFDNLCTTKYEPLDIYEELKSIQQEMEHRKQSMSEKMKENPNINAFDCGFPLHLVLMEEYLALQNSGTDTKILKEIEKILLEIAVIGRSLGICLVMITQQSSANAIPTSIRSNLPCRILFGNPIKSIYETTFETKTSSNITTNLDIGCGLASFDSINIFKFRSFIYNVDINEIINNINIAIANNNKST